MLFRAPPRPTEARVRIDFDTTYTQLPAPFYAKALPSVAVEPHLIAFNEELANQLGIERGDATEADLAALFSGAVLPEGASPIATVYAGHQFGHPVPRLGDGRAILLGEVVGRDGLRRDVQLKGAGQTPFSRGGDGRAPLGPVLREYLVSEAMHALGVPTTRSLAAVTTGGVVHRDRRLPGAVLTRVATSHLRVGTFEYFARRDRAEQEALLDYAIARHDPDLQREQDRAFSFFLRVAQRTLALVARWWGVGFVHGVMNTDNTSISGETLDFGPCAFLDTFHFDKVFSSIDRLGRYRFENQGPIAVWNLAMLGNCLVPFVDPDPQAAVARLQEAVEGFPAQFEAEWLRVMTGKLGLARPQSSDRALVNAWLERLQAEGLDYTNAFRGLADERDRTSPFHDRWRARLGEEARPPEHVTEQLRTKNPALIPRNHQVERVIAEAEAGDFTRFHRLLTALRDPYAEHPDHGEYRDAPTPEEEVEETFCGT